MRTKSFSGPNILKGNFVPPGDKSISHRAVMFGAIAEGESAYRHFLRAEDCLSTLQAFQAMGVPVRWEEKQDLLVVRGVGLRGLLQPQAELSMGNSGTTTRLLLGILAGQRFEATLTGDSSLSSRPMQRVTRPLKQMGAQIKGPGKANFLPITLRGGELKGIDFDNRLSSAQVKSAILLAGLYAEGCTRVKEAVTSRDHTEKFLEAANAPFYREGEWLVVKRAERLAPVCGEIAGDISAAAFFIVGASMRPGSELTVEGVCLNPTRTGFLKVLERMGADIQSEVTVREPERMGTVYVRGGRLKGTRISRDEIPSLIDEIPILITAMAVSEGESLISGAEELRVKETDRIESMVANLNTLGGNLEELPDGCVVRGVEALTGGRVRSYGDHRTAMSLAIASLAARGTVEVEDLDCVATSFPVFFDLFERLRC